MWTNTFTYSYDPLNRLVSANLDDAIDFTYTYDAVGNRLSETSPNGINQYIYDAANRITRRNEVEYAYDAKGNLLSDGTTNYSYNHANQLVTVAEAENVYEFAYTGSGDRLRQTVNSTNTVDYVLDTLNQYTQVLSDGSNSYLYGLGRIGEKNATDWSYHLPDALGSVRQQIDAWGDVTKTTTYDPFGNVYEAAGDAASVYGFAGEYHDQALDLIHLRARYYNPYLNQFIQADTIVPDSMNPQTINKYTYVLNNPVNYTDPSGHCAYGEMTPDGWKCYGGSIYSSGNTNSNKPSTVYYDHETSTYDTPEELTGNHSPYEIVDGPNNPVETTSPQTNIANELVGVYSSELLRQFSTEEHEYFHSYNYWAVETAAGTAWPLDVLAASIDLNINGPKAYQLFALFPDNIPFTALGKNGFRGVNFAIGFLSSGDEINDASKLVENIVSSTKKPNSKIQDLANGISNWLGDDLVSIRNKVGDYVLRNAENNKRIRFDFIKPNPHKNPHMHLEWVDDVGEWIGERVYPKDVPHE